MIVSEAYGTKLEKTRRDRGKWTRNFVCIDVPEVPTMQAEMMAYIAIRSFIAANYPVLTEQLIQSLTVTNIAPGTWQGQCTFISPTIAQQLKLEYLPEYSFTTKGGAAHITHSRKTIKKYAGWRPIYDEIKDEDGNVIKFDVRKDEDGKTVVEKEEIPELNGGIGWNSESVSYDGVDIQASTWKSTIRITVPNEFIDGYYLRMLRMLTGSVNSEPFDGMNEGECLFVGCDGTRRAIEIPPHEDSESMQSLFAFEWQLTFEFLGAPNGERWIDGIGYVYKNGWDYMHLLNRPVDYPAAKKIIPDQPIDTDPPLTSAAPVDDPTIDPNTQPPATEPELEQETKYTVASPIAAYVERVYPYADFRVLGIWIDH
jgi:hypothetical protein